MDFNEAYALYLTTLANENTDSDSATKLHLQNMKRLRGEFDRRAEAERLRHEKKKRSIYDKGERAKHSRFLQTLNKLRLP